MPCCFYITQIYKSQGIYIYNAIRLLFSGYIKCENHKFAGVPQLGCVSGRLAIKKPVRVANVIWVVATLMLYKESGVIIICVLGVFQSMHKKQSGLRTGY